MSEPIRAVLFDFDGTLTEPGNLDFPAIRSAIGCPGRHPILEHIAGLSSEQERRRAHEILDRFEFEAAAEARPNRGAEELVRRLQARSLRTGIITRNSRRSIERALANFDHLRSTDFDVIITRDDGVIPKPNPDAVVEAARRLGVRPAEMLVVGDYVYDVEAGRRAGSRTALLTNRGPLLELDAPPDYTIDHLEELEGILRLHAPLAAGKLPNSLLGPLLGSLAAPPELLVPPGVGEDAAAVRLEGEQVLVLKSDPITFTAESIGRYAVTVNANDVATTGATPRWLLATLLFPLGTTLAEVEHVVRELEAVAREQGLAVVGGHTEITDAVRRTVVSAAVAGTVGREQLIDKRRAAAGDRIILTKGISIEGTAIIARDLADHLEAAGMTRVEIERCRRLLTSPGISVLEEARIAAASGASAMHDVTEGGLATALEELSAACRRKIRVDLDRIVVLEETARVCRALHLDPLGLIGSGSLLIACRAAGCDALVAAIRNAGIDAEVIGEFLEEGVAIEAVLAGAPAPWPHFEVDELARLFGSRAPD